MFGLTPYTRRNNTPAYYDPFRYLENFEKNFFGSGELPTFKTDIRDTGDAYELEADLPGFQKENIKIDIEGEQLKIRAERKGDREERTRRATTFTVSVPSALTAGALTSAAFVRRTFRPNTTTAF